MSESTEVSTMPTGDVSPPAGEPDMGHLMELAVEKGMEGVEVLERLVALKERMMDRQANQEFNRALLAVQQHLDQNPIPIRGQVTVSKNGTKRPYPFLEDIQRALAPVCAEHGLSYSFDTEAAGNGFTVITRVSHVSGATRETRTTLPLDRSGSKNETQGVGSTESYGMRYGLIKAFGLTRYLNDDDGGGDVETVSDEQLSSLTALYDEVKGKVREDAFLSYFGIGSLEEMPAASYKEACDMLERKR